MAMMQSSGALFALGLFAALWLLAGLWAVGRGIAMQRRSAFVAGQTERLASLVEASPQLPVIVRADWRIEASERLGRWLGLERGPRNFDELRGLGSGLDAQGHDALRQAILGAQRGAKPFVLSLKPEASNRTIIVHGAAAPQAVGGAGSVLLWLSDATDGQQALALARSERDEAMTAFEALSGLIEAAPFPMWFRDTDLNLALVNTAYVRAVEAKSAVAVIDGGIELCETVAGVSAAEAADEARIAGSAQVRTIPVTIEGERRIMRVVDVPLFDHVSQEPFAAWAASVGLEPKMTCVSMGNPHVTIYCRDVAAVPLEAIGPMLEKAVIFPRRINVHFVQVHSPTEVTMRTWERGSGITLACGTGASAVCVSGALTNRHGRKILAHLPGGDLELRWGDDNHVYMTGPAEEVFQGEMLNAE